MFARCLSSLKSERIEASKVLKGKTCGKYEGDKKEFIEHIRKVTYLLSSCNTSKLFLFQALYASKIVSYAQGFMLLREAAKQYNWKLNYGGIALMWRGGCIIRRYTTCHYSTQSHMPSNLVVDSWATSRLPLTRTQDLSTCC
ncbi:MAG: hypothetical protein GDA38_21675 [Hormoscilla sp. SP12CHS1]|nr:hypothetical protein [Hormoscilla sp. SP12CHS1]